MSRKDFASKLRELVTKRAKLNEISKVAFRVYQENRSTDEVFDDALMELIAMEQGYEFEMSYEEILQIAESLDN